MKEGGRVACVRVCARVCARARRRVRASRQEDVDIGRSARGLKLCVVQSAATMSVSLCIAISYTSPMQHPV